MKPFGQWTAVGAVVFLLAGAAALRAQAQQSEPPAAPGGTAIQGITPTGELINMSAAELTDKHVYSNDGEDLGEVERVVVGQADNVPHAVVEVGGFLGFGATPVAIPFDMLRLQGEDIYITRTFAEGQLKSQFPYSETRYREVAEDRIIADVIGAGTAGQAAAPATTPPPAGQTAASFDSMDLNGDGYITMSEAAGNESLSYNWREVDRNNDGLIDPAEFSAFEQTDTGTEGSSAPSAGSGPPAAPAPSGPAR